MDGSFLNAGLDGVDSHDNPATVRAWRWLRWVLFAFSLLAIPAFYMQLTAGSSFLFELGRALYLCMFMGFASLLAWITYLSRERGRFLRRNRFDALILVGAAASATWGITPWPPLEWVLRIAFMGVVAMRIVFSLRDFLSPNRLLWLFVAAAVLLPASGAVFYWLEPRVHSYAEGVWLAFESSATVGYGDIAPTTPASRIFAAFVVLLGYGMLSLVFASIAAMFVGQEEKALRREMHRDIRHLHSEIAALRKDVHDLREAGIRRGSSVDKDHRNVAD
ncbi:potassium channel family protein [Paraburkholderia sp. BL10I2N1]|uniref:potassium channel family protein n=1 Tax=Paraburkholderia sp. BL10I2N1 TaxID=1938796 RepID=UPI00105D1AED|nr:potassium channel family protein [Paraburkholderia sp. BL10I2N1]TDN63204.1 voltage-gated potassium channel [Paraburkholderia sp. BL10I2N1]